MMVSVLGGTIVIGCAAVLARGGLLVATAAGRQSEAALAPSRAEY